MKKIIVFFIYFLIGNVFAASPDTIYTKTYGGTGRDELTSIQKTYDGGYITVGSINSYNGNDIDILLLKINALGDTAWQKTFGSVASDYGHSVTQGHDSGFVLIGDSELPDSSAWRGIIIKTNDIGDSLWSLFLGNDSDYCIPNSIISIDSCYVISGGIHNLVTGLSDIFLIKINNEGEIIWQNNFGAINVEEDGYNVHQTSDHGFIIVGKSIKENPGYADVLLLKTNHNGEFQWQKTYGGTEADRGYSVRETNDGGYIIVGETSSFGKGGYDVWVIRTDFQGNILWQDTYGGDNQDSGCCIESLSDNGFVIGANSASNVFLIRIDEAGDSVWTKTLGGLKRDEIKGIVEAHDGGIIFAGLTSSYGSGSLDGWVVKIEKEFINCDFTATILKGNVPLTVSYLDQSTTNAGKIDSWQWDFNNDGFIDSEEQNPTWTYSDADTYSVKLIVSNSIFSDTLIREDYIITYLDSFPNIYSIEDVPNDQGGWVKVNFARSVYDTDSLILAKVLSAEMYTVEINDSSGWIAVASTVAYGKSLYSVLVPTTKDSTSESDGIISFRVIAGMDEGNFVSNIMTGYSVDNLHPSVPQNISGKVINEEYIQLIWAPVTDEDFRYYQIYRSADGVTFEIFDSTIDTVYIDNTVVIGNSYYYSLKAVDHSGNESEFSNIVNILFTDINTESGIPTQYYLLQNYPNPFNSQTTIRYGLIKSSEVKIIIYDILGNKIVDLVNSAQSAGHYQVIWNGRDNNDSVVASGLYIYQLKSGNSLQRRKMLFIR